MPTLLQIFGFRFYIYSEEHEPIHIHVDYGDAWAKIELEPTVTLVYNHGMKQKELLALLQERNIEINASGLSKLEGQIRSVPDYELIALADALEISVPRLLGLED